MALDLQRQHAKIENETSRHSAHFRCAQNGHFVSGKSQMCVLRAKLYQPFHGENELITDYWACAKFVPPHYQCSIG
jgi:hypothetical protein